MSAQCWLDVRPMLAMVGCLTNRRWADIVVPTSARLWPRRRPNVGPTISCYLGLSRRPFSGPGRALRPYGLCPWPDKYHLQLVVPVIIRREREKLILDMFKIYMSDCTTAESRRTVITLLLSTWQVLIFQNQPSNHLAVTKLSLGPCGKV